MSEANYDMDELKNDAEFFELLNPKFKLVRGRVGGLVYDGRDELVRIRSKKELDKFLGSVAHQAFRKVVFVVMPPPNNTASGASYRIALKFMSEDDHAMYKLGK